MSDSAPECVIELIAGQHPNGDTVMEKLLVSQQADGSYQLLKSPLFVRGIARADIIQSMAEPKGAFKIQQHGGNLCIRVFAREGLSAIEQALTLELEKLGGDLDLKTDNALVYSIHVSCGFNAIEAILNKHLAGREDSAWYYGNVYDPQSGEPLNWWQPILSES
jgi:hypothetical protein